MTEIPKHFILAGKPGCGRSTLIEEATLPFRERIGGFLCRQMTEEGVRIGFELTTLDGRRGVLASKRVNSPVKLNKYGIDIDVLEGIGVATLREAREAGKVLVIDEIGPLLTASEAFREELQRCLSGEPFVLGTVRLGASEFIETIETLGRTRLETVTRERFMELKKAIRAWLEKAVGR